MALLNLNPGAGLHRTAIPNNRNLRSKLRIGRSRLITIPPLLLTLAGVASWAVTSPDSDIQIRVLDQLHGHGVALLSPEAIPQQLAQAVVAIEGERFYDHHGVDPVAIGRAVLFDVSHGCWCQGGSTITEQLVKDVYLNGSDHGPNKLIDVVVAFKVESAISKQQILADYLSEIPTGPGLYAVSAAVCAYFGRPLADLSLEESALLAGLAQAPNAYDPETHPAAALRRRRAVLDARVPNARSRVRRPPRPRPQPSARAGARANADHT